MLLLKQTNTLAACYHDNVTELLIKVNIREIELILAYPIAISYTKFKRMFVMVGVK